MKKLLLFPILAAFAVLSCGGGDDMPCIECDEVNRCPNVSFNGSYMSCGNQSYGVVYTNGRYWMSQNLNYAVGNSKCYGGDSYYCNRYGRLYDWTTAKAVCPNGWHLPSQDEFYDLVMYNNFSAQFGGYGNSSVDFSGAGDIGRWWSASEYRNSSSNSNAYYMYMSYYDDYGMFVA